MSKVDLKKEQKHLYSPSAKAPIMVDVPRMNFLMIDGKGDPNTSQDFRDAIEALYGVSYTLKFMIKKSSPADDYVVMPLEGLWWVENMAIFDAHMKDLWQWTAMIMQPESVTKKLFDGAAKEVAKKKNPPALSKMRFEKFHEGLSAQIMYIGPFPEEGPTISRIHEFIKENGYNLSGKHHEIYLSDPRKTAPEELKTVIRQPAK
jgi:hypothetical protein